MSLSTPYEPLAGFALKKKLSIRRNGFLCCGILFAACNGGFLSTSGGRSPDPTELRIATEVMPTQLDPRFALDAYSSRVTGLVFASLTTPSPDGDYRPYLAEHWEWLDDRTCRFVLRDGARFHTGDPVRSRDVVATYQALMDPELGSPKRALLSRLAAVRTDGERAVVFELSQPDASFLEASTLPILPAGQAAARDIAATTLIGSGPFRLTTVRDDDRIVLSAVERPSDGGPPIQRVTFKVVPDGMMRAIELMHGDVDFVQNAIDPDTVEWLAENHKEVQVLRGPSNNFQYLGMNLEDPRLADVRVRRAIAMAIDRSAIVDYVLAGQAEVASGLLPPGHWAYSGRVRRYRYDPSAAAQLLDRAGLRDPDGPGPLPRTVFSYKTTTHELPRRVAEAIAAQLAAVGIKLEVLSYEWGTFFEDVRRGNFHIYSLQWVGIADPDIFRQVFHSEQIPPEGNNRGRYRDPEMDRLTARGITATDRGQRKRIYARVQRRAASRLPYIPLWWPDRIVVATRRLEGFVPHPSGDLLELRAARLKPRLATTSGRSGNDEVVQRH